MFTLRRFRGISKLTPLMGCLILCISPVLAKHAKLSPATNIFTPPADVATQPSFINKNKTATVPKLLDGTEEPRWDIVKALPDLSGDQMKSLNKLQQDTQKGLNVLRTQMNDANQELKDLKAHKPAANADSNPVISMLSPDGKPYMGPMLGTEEMGMDPAEENIEDVQAQIDGIKEKIKETNIKASAQAKTLLSQDQQNELDLMRQGKLVVPSPKNFLVDSPSEPSKGKHDIASSANNAGARVLRGILSGTAKGIRSLQQDL